MKWSRVEVNIKIEPILVQQSVNITGFIHKNTVSGSHEKSG